MKTNWYAEAIEIVTNPKTDFKAMLIEIAKKHPKVVVDARKYFEEVSEGNGWRAQVRAMAKDGGSKIQAIKLCRELTDLGLKEAKEAVEEMFPVWPNGHLEILGQ